MTSKLAIDFEKCTGCGICELACSYCHDSQHNPERSRIRVIRNENEGVLYSVPVVCQQCETPSCKVVCPTRAIMRDVKTDALIVDPNKCIGCRMCFNSCPIGGMSVEQNKGTAMKCDLCDGQPRCVEFCPTGALKYSRLDKISVLKKREEIGKYFETLKSVAHLLTEERGDGK